MWYLFSEDGKHYVVTNDERDVPPTVNATPLHSQPTSEELQVLWNNGCEVEYFQHIE